ncbi:signal peptidase II [Micromonospora aurantiaca (nom. illeg.)]|uniref:signal peptidase II n=1 Tax=Micromonospora aurantiaca (nom. illeg.) TaxID=47850 RepID=UPI001656AE83|nr:signal peptidase II [Micromonospora aurantiaca]MBC9002305.1 signal peptidase II [Micromonospora aurantiaca]
MSAPRTAASLGAARGWLAGAALLAVAIDVASKSAAAAWLPGRSVELLGGLYLRLTRNPGAAFSIGTDFTPVFTIVAVAVIAGISWYARNVTHRGWATALGLIVGGAAGNLVDRLFRAPGVGRGHVVDFLYLDWWPTFNLADSFLVCGVAVAVLLSLRNVPLTAAPPTGGDGVHLADTTGGRDGR